MAIDKDRIKKQQRKRVYERNKRNVKKSSEIDLSNAEQGKTIDLSDKPKTKTKAVRKAVKAVSEHDDPKDNSNEDTAKENVKVYGKTAKTVTSKAVKKGYKLITAEGKVIEGKGTLKENNQNISAKSNILLGNTFTSPMTEKEKRKEKTKKRKHERQYRKNRKRVFKAKRKAAKQAAVQKLSPVEKAKKKLIASAAKLLVGSTAVLLGGFILLMPLILLLSVGAGGEAYNQSQTVAQVTYPADDSDINQAITYWQSLQVQIKARLEKVPDLSGIKDRYTNKKSSICEFMTDSNALLSFLSAYYIPYVDAWHFEDARDLIDEIFGKMYVIEYSISGDTLDYKISEKMSWEDILNEYLSDEQKKKYQDYFEHKGGAVKAFSSPFAFDWSGYITSPFGYRDWGGGDVEFHKGVDFGVPHGTEELAIADGTVVKTYTACTHDYPKDYGCGCGGNYGNYVDILTDDGQYYITYGHMSEVYVNVGDTVKNGQVVGLSGCTGWSTGNHLHLEMRLGYEQGELIDPLTYIQDYVPLEQKGEKQ